MADFNCELGRHKKISPALRRSCLTCRAGEIVITVIDCRFYFCRMIHESKIFELAQVLKTFSLAWVAENGERIKVDKCTCTSFHSSGDTMNVVIQPSGLVRKVNRKTIVEINGEEVFI